MEKCVVYSMSLAGLRARRVRITAERVDGAADVVIMGLTEARARDARGRVASALHAIGAPVDHRVHVYVDMRDEDDAERITVAIALAVLAAEGRLRLAPGHGTVVLGALGTAGKIEPVRGVLPALRRAWRDLDFVQAIVPIENGAEAAHMAGDMLVRAVEDLGELRRHFAEGVPVQILDERLHEALPPPVTDMSELGPLHPARRAMEVAAAGGHHLLVRHPATHGVMSIACRMPGILPPPSDEEALEIAEIQSLLGILPPAGAPRSRPCRMPHHTVSLAGLLGTAEPAVRPGELSLAHGGVLFLGELHEFREDVLRALREPLREGRVVLSRGARGWELPSAPLVVGAITSCPCGYAGEPGALCVCRTAERVAHLAAARRLLPVRFDLELVLPPRALVPGASATPGESSRAVQQRVVAARAAQRARHEDGARVPLNAQLEGKDLEVACAMNQATARALAKMVERHRLSTVDCARILRVARTIADLAGAAGVEEQHLLEAGPAPAFDGQIPALPAPEAAHSVS